MCNVCDLPLILRGLTKPYLSTTIGLLLTWVESSNIDGSLRPSPHFSFLQENKLFIELALQFNPAKKDLWVFPLIYWELNIKLWDLIRMNFVLAHYFLLPVPLSSPALPPGRPSSLWLLNSYLCILDTGVIVLWMGLVLFLWTNHLMNEGAHHWASSLDFLVGQRKRGNRRELLPLGTRSVESSDVAVRVS